MAILSGRLAPVLALLSAGRRPIAMSGRLVIRPMPPGALQRHTEAPQHRPGRLLVRRLPNDGT